MTPKRDKTSRKTTIKTRSRDAETFLLTGPNLITFYIKYKYYSKVLLFINQFLTFLSVYITWNRNDKYMY